MTYYELYKKAEYQLEHNKINIGEFEKMIEPLNRDVETQTNTAEWIIVGKTTFHYECSICGGAGDKWDKFCKHCGRKMTNAVAE